MYYFRTCVLVLLVQVGYSYCFPWDNVVGGEKLLEFYHAGTISHTEEIPTSNYMRTITYDPVHYRVLFAYQNNSYISISSFDPSTRETEPLYTTISTDVRDQSLAYDPVTQLIFWSEGYSLYSLSLKPATFNKTVELNLLLKLNQTYIRDIAVDSCGGYIYWITDDKIEKARFDGSGRQVLIDSTVWYRSSFAIDQQTQKMYWSEKIKKNNDYQMSIESADLNGEKRRTLYASSAKYAVTVLTVSKDFIYWKTLGESTIRQIPKNPPHDVKPKVFPISKGNCWHCQAMATNYTIEEQTQGTKSCEALKWLVKEFTHVSAENGSACDISVCYNYCFQGDCSVSAEGQPECRCNFGYSGERCEINSCHKHCLNGGICSLNEEDEPACECTTDFEGARCDVSVCKDFCFQGDCSVSAEGLRNCRCNAGYSGERCEVNACHEYCLNNGVCSLNKQDEPVCQCTGDYNGKRCDVPSFLFRFIEPVSTWRDRVHTDDTLVTPLSTIAVTTTSTSVETLPLEE